MVYIGFWVKGLIKISSIHSLNPKPEYPKVF